MGAMTLPLGPPTGRDYGVSSNGKRTVTALLAPSTSYATGGDTLPIADLGLKRIDAMYQVCNVNNNAGLSFDLAGTPEARLVKAYDVAPAGTEVVNATNLSTRGIIQVLFEGYSV